MKIFKLMSDVMFLSWLLYKSTINGFNNGESNFILFFSFVICFRIFILELYVFMLKTDKMDPKNYFNELQNKTVILLI